MKVPSLNLDKSKYIIDRAQKWTGRNFVTKLNKSGAILPVVLLEATVTGGRTYQAYQRDGFVEARERVTEESLGAVFWLFGASMFGRLFDKIGQKFLKIPKTMPDVGRDIVRTPFDNYIQSLAKIFNMSPQKAEAIKKNLARYSVGKTAASIITACLFIGYVVPKLNQAITKHLFGKMQNNAKNDNASDNNQSKLTLKDARSILFAKDVSINAVENFKAQKAIENKDNKQSGSVPSFKAGADSLLRIVQNFEENDVWKLMGTDVGTVSGRTLNARNKDERVEIMFRDISSIYFYCFSMPAIVAFMNKKDVFGGLNTKLNPMSAAQVHNYLVEEMAKKGIDNMSAKRFKEFALGNDSYDIDLYKKVFPDIEEKPAKSYLFGLIKKKPNKEYRIISLSDLENIVDSHYVDKTKAAKIKEAARKMSGLQPQKGGVNIITESQLEDVLRGGIVRKPEFMKDALNEILKDKHDASPLTNKYRYISTSKIEEYRTQIIDYVKAIVQDAEKNKTNVSWESMKKMNKRNLNKNGLFMILAMGVSSLFLSTIIPKVQYYITYLRTGKNSFPGTENIQKK